MAHDSDMHDMPTAEGSPVQEREMRLMALKDAVRAGTYDTRDTSLAERMLRRAADMEERGDELYYGDEPHVVPDDPGW